MPDVLLLFSMHHRPTGAVCTHAQVAACVRHDPRVLDELRAAAAKGGSGGAAGNRGRGWGMPSVQALSQGLAPPEGQQAQQAQRRGKGGAAGAAGARPVRWGVAGAHLSERGRGGGRRRLAVGDSYDPDDDSDFSDDDPLEGGGA
jgi:hypothetical protein